MNTKKFLQGPLGVTAVILMLGFFLILEQPGNFFRCYSSQCSFGFLSVNSKFEQSLE